MRHKTIAIRLSDLEYNSIKSRASKIGLRVADFVRMTTLESNPEIRGTVRSFQKD